jgi:hypothetical protein
MAAPVLWMTVCMDLIKMLLFPPAWQIESRIFLIQTIIRLKNKNKSSE